MVRRRCEAAVFPSDLSGYLSDWSEQFWGPAGSFWPSGKGRADCFADSADRMFCHRLVSAGPGEEPETFSVELRKFNRIVIVSFCFVRYAYRMEN